MEGGEAQASWPRGIWDGWRSSFSSVALGIDHMAPCHCLPGHVAALPSASPANCDTKSWHDGKKRLGSSEGFQFVFYTNGKSQEIPSLQLFV